MSRKLAPEDFKSEKFDLPPEKLAKHLREQLYGIVKGFVSRIPSGASIGVLSSGGIDSTSILAILVELGYAPTAITLGFGDENDEIQSARATARHLGVPHMGKVTNTLLQSTAEANSVLDEPYRAACVYYEAVRFARESGVGYLFDGLGVDEFYGGYAFRYKRVEDFVKNGIDKVESYVRGAHPCDYTDDQSILGPRLRNVRVDWSGLFPYFTDTGIGFFDQVLLADYNTKCRQNFIPLARHGEKLGVKIYYPWLADTFVNFALRVPARLKYDPSSGNTKILFRKAVEDLVPPEAMAKSKQGFGPLSKRVLGQLQTFGEEKVLDGRLVSLGYLNRDFYKNVLAGDSSSDIGINKLWDAYTLETFLEEEEVK